MAAKQLAKSGSGTGGRTVFGMPSLVHQGKVRDTHRLPDPALRFIFTSDRVSIFDAVIGEIPGRGRILTAMTDFWLQQSPISEVAPNHLVPFETEMLPEWARPLRDRIAVVRVAKMQPIEWIVRSHLGGSAWREYRKRGTMHGAPMPPGMLECQELPEPVVTSSTKAPQGERDQNITFDEAVATVGLAAAEEARRICLESYRIAADHCRRRGVVLLDTKFELGEIDGRLAICDEVLTADSSRFTLVKDYKPGEPHKAYDKEFLRQWGRRAGWTGDGPPPHLPGHVIREARYRYETICQQLIGMSPA